MLGSTALGPVAAPHSHQCCQAPQLSLCQPQRPQLATSGTAVGKADPRAADAVDDSGALLRQRFCRASSPEPNPKSMA
jgi:hypothetical protein